MDFRQAQCLRLEYIPGTCLGLTKIDPNTGKPVTDRQFDNVVKVPGRSKEVMPFVAPKLILHLVLAEEDGGREVEVPMFGFVRRFRPLTEPRRRALFETMLGSHMG